MKRTLKNSQIVVMLQQLQPLLSYRNKVGYFAARNYRILSDALVEYEAFRRELIEKYGDVEKDENGADTGTIVLDIKSPNFKQFSDELAPLNEIEQEVELMIAKYDDAIGCLTGEELLNADWMFED